ncbi:YdeI/OmpD-associated family protein [Parafrankia sp. FMc2]|uniref:YdeI/OmpD-associated family protein n=1 Tax=Parafrankia sp. FMc2 TaxID=3233196 RepID=UPI0034D6C9C5
MTAPGPPVGLPTELAAALDATADAREQWGLQPEETRQLYARWVAKAAAHRTRQKRAERTANYAATGALHRSVQRQRDRGITQEMISALRFSLVISPIIGVATLLVDGHINWPIAIMTGLAGPGTAVREAWRHPRAPVASTMTGDGTGRDTAQDPHTRRCRGPARERAGSGRHRQANADKNEDAGSR